MTTALKARPLTERDAHVYVLVEQDATEHGLTVGSCLAEITSTASPV